MLSADTADIDGGERIKGRPGNRQRFPCCSPFDRRLPGQGCEIFVIWHMLIFGVVQDIAAGIRLNVLKIEFSSVYFNAALNLSETSRKLAIQSSARGLA